ncbi:hypothetical protein D8Y22_19395 [Salinadaptatus halalkaliphilus]|uniref:Uncharacterized protein n=1 Tax=Salinadaptatus halalkaliphilus TaxID=2419781 RepID=A0A4S3TI88_9EURY|nr:hypothetical protein D8Y22_19395 [Salinadaptatus halalkaliphilus]
MEWVAIVPRPTYSSPHQALATIVHTALPVCPPLPDGTLIRIVVTFYGDRSTGAAITGKKRDEE